MNSDGSDIQGNDTFRIAHISDIHFGRIAQPEIVGALVEEINEAKVDLVVASGDLTQRAFPHQYRAAASMLEAFHAPWMAVPGNHDVFPWWRTLSRLFDPLRRYRRYISRELTPSFVLPGLAVLGINSAYGRTIKGGHVEESQRQAMRTFFEKAPAGSMRILVVHHHLTLLHDLGSHDVAREAEETLACAANLDVDLILCGHLHISHVAHIQVVPFGHPIIIATAGTATSDRGRKPHKKTNFFNLIEISTAEFEIVERQFKPDMATFAEESRSTFPRRAHSTAH